MDGGILGINANVKENKITQIKFEGDFLTLLGTEYIEKLLINQDFEKANIKKILLMVKNLENYFGQISVNEIIDIMFGE
ncbi:lipoate protein ligase C-terminal domain-containing protein [Mycoplasmopsis cynos]|uniref:lipoate protein ligase C-terminal domain-containing protein n=1 Tax=Mycoplasmopsis cynos TaxID=171284 RepID=UPI002FF0F93B